MTTINLNISAAHVQVEGAKDASTDVNVHLKSVDPVEIIRTVLNSRMNRDAKEAVMRAVMGGLSGTDEPDNNERESGL